MTHLITAEQISRYYGKHLAVDNVSFTLSKGQVIGFLGQNGAGKTTTLQMLSGNLAPSAGRILINGYDIQKHAQRAKQSLGYLPDTPPLYKELTVNEYLHYCAQLHRLLKPARAKAIQLATERCALTTVAHRLIGSLSKGFQQRVGLAQAILHNPELIILDEPTVGLDPLQIKEICTLIRELGQDHGILLSTHRLSEVQNCCSHVQIIHQGHLVLSESVQGLSQHISTGCLQITTRLKPDIQILAAIAGVSKIEEINERQLKIFHDPSSDPGQHIAEIVIHHGWELQELTPIKQSMEELFITLTQSNDECA